MILLVFMLIKFRLFAITAKHGNSKTCFSYFRGIVVLIWAEHIGHISDVVSVMGRYFLYWFFLYQQIMILNDRQTLIFYFLCKIIWLYILTLIEIFRVNYIYSDPVHLRLLTGLCSCWSVYRDETCPTTTFIKYHINMGFPYFHEIGIQHTSTDVHSEFSTPVVIRSDTLSSVYYSSLRMGGHGKFFIQCRNEWICQYINNKSQAPSQRPLVQWVTVRRLLKIAWSGVRVHCVIGEFSN